MKRGPGRIERRPDHGRPIVDPQFEAILADAKRELERQTAGQKNIHVEKASPLDIPMMAPLTARRIDL